MRDRDYIITLADYRQADEAFTACVRHPFLRSVLNRKDYGGHIMFRLPERRFRRFRSAVLGILGRQGFEVTKVETLSEWFDDIYKRRYAAPKDVVVS